ncbi:MAG: hypothetical protein K2N87_05180 [Eubacterium sp.]|nr:hypothetical protein [Eubacterium sp.]
MGGNYSKSIYNQLMDVMGRLEAMKSECKNNRKEVTALNQEVKRLQKENSRLKEELSTVKAENAALHKESATLRKVHLQVSIHHK